MLDQGLAEIHRIDLEKRIEIEEEKRREAKIQYPFSRGEILLDGLYSYGWSRKDGEMI